MRPILALLAGTLFISPLFAHQQKAAYIEVLFNQRSNQIEISHRFEIHDAEHAVHQLFGGQADILSSPDTQRAFYEYALEHFSLADQVGQSLPLQPIGFEVEGKYFWAYQVTAYDPSLTALVISSSALQDLWPDQVNWVNFKRDGEVETAVFETGQREIEIQFD